MNAVPAQDAADPSRHPADVRCRAHKFGGSSLADAARIRRVADLMLDELGEKRFVFDDEDSKASLVVRHGRFTSLDTWSTTKANPRHRPPSFRSF